VGFFEVVKVMQEIQFRFQKVILMICWGIPGTIVQKIIVMTYWRNWRTTTIMMKEVLLLHVSWGTPRTTATMIKEALLIHVRSVFQRWS
jgi:hypothetical protein